MALDPIDHVAIPVQDIAASVEWYRARFQCEIVYQDETWAMLKFANTQLAFVVPEQHPPHVGFVVKNAESYGELTVHRDGTRSRYVEDPSGNAVEVLAPYE